MPDPLTDIQKQYRKIVYTALAAAACMIFGLFSLLYAVPVGVMLIAAAIIIYFALFRPNRRYYADLVNRTNLERTICRLIDSDPPSPVGGGLLTKQMLIDADFMPEGANDTDPLFCWEMKGSRKGYGISLADTTMLQRYMGPNGKYVYHTSSGVFSVFTLPSDTQRYFLVMDRQFLPDTVREMFMNTKPDYVNEPLGDKELDERYFFYRSTRDDPGAVPAAFLQSLKRLMKYTPGFTAITVKGGMMYSFITDRFVSQRIPLSVTISIEDLDSDQFPELSYLINIASTLGRGGAVSGRGKGRTAETDDDQDDTDADMEKEGEEE